MATQNTELSRFQISDMTAVYLIDGVSQMVSLCLVPKTPDDPRLERAVYEPLDPLAHVKIVGDSYSGAFAQGHTMRSSPSIDHFRYNAQDVEHSDGLNMVTTSLDSPIGWRIAHVLSWHDGDFAVKITTQFHNGSGMPVTLEMLTSFSLGVCPFAKDDLSGQLRVHRFRSVWSAEGRQDTQTLEELHLERSWSGAGLFSERFGQVGSMPVRRWFPFAAVENVTTGEVWAAQLGWAGSWQIEVSRQFDQVCLSGGLADREFGHWMKTLAAGETITTPPAFVTTACGTLDTACDNLTALQHRSADRHPAVEHDLPIIFNEWCTTWGSPSHDKIVALADRLSGSAVKYLVIDAGWYRREHNLNWSSGHGDWIPGSEFFPDGLRATADAIRERGMIPGLWFEMETVGTHSTAFSLTDHLLKRDGIPVTVRNRRFWDLNDAFAIDYLAKRVIGLLEECGFGYLKVDYNETIGLGCDGAESLGEGLRRQINGVYRLFERIRHQLPDLVIENCASGGHRLERSMLALSAMSSFSDAHESVEIPLIAANLHALMLPRQSQIWAVLHADDNDDRLIYSLAATFLGRMCLSGDVDSLSTAQWETVEQAMALYRRSSPIIKEGASRRFGRMGTSWQHPTGWQAVVRTAADLRSLLLVGHVFANAPRCVDVPLPEGKWHVAEQFGSPDIIEGEIDNSKFHWEIGGDFTARIALLVRDDP